MTQPSHISLPQFEELRALLDEDFVDLIHTYMEDSLQRLSQDGFIGQIHQNQTLTKM
jgi:histidine phosphotransfer protein HptB